MTNSHPTTLSVDERIDIILTDLADVVDAGNYVHGQKMGIVYLTKDLVKSLIKEICEEVTKKPTILPKGSNSIESVKQGINFYNKTISKRLNTLLGEGK